MSLKSQKLKGAYSNLFPVIAAETFSALIAACFHFKLPQETKDRVGFVCSLCGSSLCCSCFFCFCTENAWFLSSCSWPCDPADLENRARVLKHLAEKTSQRETLEILRNMPGMERETDHLIYAGVTLDLSLTLENSADGA